MSEHNIFTLHSGMPKRVSLADITIRDGFQHEENWIPTEAKIYYLQELAFAGVRRMEVTNLGSSRVMPQFKDAEEVFKGVHDEIFLNRLANARISSGPRSPSESPRWTAP